MKETAIQKYGTYVRYGVGNVKQIIWTEIRHEAYERTDETSASPFCSFLWSVFFAPHSPISVRCACEIIC